MSRMSSLVSGGRMIRNACGNDHADHRAAVRHAERARGLHLPLGHGLDAGPDGLGHVGAADQAQGQGDDAEVAERDLVGGERQVEAHAQRDEDDQGGEPAEELDDPRRDPPVGPHAREAHQRQHQAERQAEGEAARGVDDRVLQRDRQDLGELLLDQLPVPERPLDLAPVGDEGDGEDHDHQHGVLDVAPPGGTLAGTRHGLTSPSSWGQGRRHSAGRCRTTPRRPRRTRRSRSRR